MPTIDLTAPLTWASNVNYTVGGDVGTPNKVDPGLALANEGFIPGGGLVAQHLNHNLNAIGVAQTTLVAEAKRSLAARILALREVTRVGATGVDDTAEALAAVSIGQAFEIVVAKAHSGGVQLISDVDRFQQGSPLASITGTVRDAAFGAASRIVVVGSGGNFNCYSDNNGSTWTAGGATGLIGPVTGIVWNSTAARFICTSDPGGVARSTTAVTWTDAGSNSLSGGSGAGIATFNVNRTVICGSDGGSAPAFSISTNGGVTWADSANTVADPGTYSEPGWVVGNGGPTIWHVGRRGGANLRVSSSGSSGVWVTQADIVAPLTLGTRPRILCCQNTGLLVIAAPSTLSGTTFLYASVDGGNTWLGPHVVANIPIEAFALAGGRLIATRDAMLFASAGVGWA